MASAESGFDNPGFKDSSNNIDNANLNERNGSITSDKNTLDPSSTDDVEATPVRENWGNGLEFLMSCIALSVGLGNVWRFPFIALENGGGAFLIPYIIVLILVGKPIYYLEMILGQFSSRGSVKLYDYAPIMRGIGYGQVLATFFICTYYASLMALTVRYLITSFYSVLPWSYCREEWGPLCIDSKLKEVETTFLERETGGDMKKTSAEYYFINIILREKPNIDDGIGTPNWTLVLTLAFSWICIVLITIRGIRTSGKAAYFLALFPYVIMLILLVRALTLPGAFDGVLYFLKPQWDKLLDANVWYAAVTQVFFSLSVCYGVIIMYSSFNRFNHNINRDSNIITALDTFTSLLSGIIIFGILGNLAHETGTTDIQNVVQGGPGLAFISYPDAISKFNAVPQLFSVLFFLMLFILGVGSNVGAATCVITLVCEQFPNIKRWILVVGIAVICFCFGLMYVTPGGQYMLNLIDFFGVTLVAIVLGIFELITAGWIYGVKNLCRDIKFMLNINTSIYYRLCWSLITPGFMAAILIFMLVGYKPLEYNGVRYPTYLYVVGWCIFALAVGQLLVWGIYTVYKRPELSFTERFLNSFKPNSEWGPLEPANLKVYNQTIDDSNIASANNSTKRGFWYKIYDNIFK